MGGSKWFTSDNVCLWVDDEGVLEGGLFGFHPNISQDVPFLPLLRVHL